MYAHDRSTGETMLISRAKDGFAAAAPAFRGAPAISDDGRFVGFASSENIVGTLPDRNDRFGTRDIYVFDRVTQTSVRITPAADGTFADDDCDNIHRGFLLSKSGRYAVYGCAATNLVTGDTNGWKDTFMFDLVTGVNTRVSVATDGSQLTDWETNPLDMTPDAKYLLVRSTIRNFDPTSESPFHALFLLELNREDSGPSPPTPPQPPPPPETRHGEELQRRDDR